MLNLALVTRMEGISPPSREVASLRLIAPPTLSTSQRPTLEASSQTAVAPCLGFQSSTARATTPVSCQLAKTVLLVLTLTPLLQDSITQRTHPRLSLQTTWVTRRLGSCKTSRPIAPSRLVSKYFRITSCFRRLALKTRATV